MARRALLLAGAVLAAGAALASGDDGPPQMPAGVCDASPHDQHTSPRWGELTTPLAGGGATASFGVVLGRLDNEGPESAEWTATQLRRALLVRGFAPWPGGATERWHRPRPVPATLELYGPLPDRAAALEPALTLALSHHRVVYYHGHSHRGDLGALADLPAAGHRLVVIDTCHSAQFYTAPWIVGAAPGFDRIVNRGRSVTGSIGSFVPVLDALLTAAETGTGPSWAELLAQMNQRAVERAARRPASGPFSEPERYGRAQRCPASG